MQSINVHMVKKDIEKSKSKVISYMYACIDVSTYECVRRPTCARTAIRPLRGVVHGINTTYL